MSHPPAPLLWKTSRRTLDLTSRGLVMGILNFTPDSFTDGGRFNSPERALAHADEMVSEGADILDIGGESSRPGADPVSAEEEMGRVLPLVRELRRRFPEIILSVDTWKASVAGAALEAGAEIINDISGLAGDPEMAPVAARHQAGVVAMHMQGWPQVMQDNPAYTDVVAEVAGFFRSVAVRATAAGLDPLCLSFDPGIGFGKTVAHNLTLIARLDELAVDGRPVVLGVSRKSFIARTLGSSLDDFSDRSWPTVALTCHGRILGARVFRVHEVGPNSEALRMTDAILAA